MQSVIVLFGIKRIIEGAKKAGLFVINVIIENMLSGTYLKAAKVADVSIVIKDLSEIESLVEALIRKYNIIAITSFTDTNVGVFRAASLSEKYLAENRFLSSEAVSVLYNKYKTRQYLDNVKLNNTLYSIIKNNADLEEIMQKCNEIVLKPIEGQGSEGVVFLSSGDCIDELNLGVQDLMLAESYLRGREVSVELIVIHKRVFVLGITEKRIIGRNSYGHNEFVECGHIFPAIMSSGIQSKIIDYISRLYNGLAITNCLGHAEIMIVDDEPILIEAHARAGGDCIPELIEIATGQDVFELFFRSLIESPQLVIKCKKRAMIGYPVTNCGKIVSYNDLGNCEGLVKNRLELEIGKEVKPILNSFDRVLGHIICEDSDNPQHIYDKAISQINIIVE